MIARRLLPIFIAAACAGAAGYYIGRQNPEPPPPAETKPVTARPAPAPPSPPAAPARLSSQVSTLVGIEPITAANAAKVAWRILEEPDPRARMTACLVLIESMTAENAQAILQTFRDITARTGRKHDAEWALMVRRYGALRGAEGLKDLMPAMFNVGLAVEGLATQDPEAALAAIRESGITDPHLATAWLNGICVKDPARALTLAFSGQYNNADGGVLLKQAISCVGVESARELLQKAIDDAPENAGNSSVFKSCFGALGEALFHKNLTLGTPGEMLPWLEQQKNGDYLPAGFISRAAHENLTAGNVDAALKFLESMSEGRPAPRGVERLYESAGADPKIVGNMDEAACARLIKLLPPDPPALMKLADSVETVNPERAAQLRRSLDLPPP